MDLPLMVEPLYCTLAVLNIHCGNTNIFEFTNCLWYGTVNCLWCSQLFDSKLICNG